VSRPRLLALNQYYPPAVEADGRLLAELCEGLSDAWDVTVVTGAVPTGAPRRERVNGVDVVRVPSTAYGRRRLSLRGLNYATYFLLGGAYGLSSRPADLVYCMTNPPFVGDLAYFLARRSRAPLVVTVQDVFPETAVVLGRLESPVAVTALRALVGFYLHRADRVVAVGETMRRRLEEKGAPGDRIRVVSNWVDTDAIRPVPQNNAWAGMHGLAGRFVVMHSGNVGHAQGLGTLVEAATRIDDADVVIVGDGVLRPELEELSRGLSARVRFLPYQPREVLSESLSAASVHVVGLARGLAGYVVPSRVYAVLAVGRPVIAVADAESETAALVQAAGCGLVVSPGDSEELAAAIRRFRDGDIDGGELGRRGREYVVSHASREVALRRYRDVFDEVRRS
jgi:glycosyltransferase involved in cell wall biosynthesis